MEPRRIRRRRDWWVLQKIGRRSWCDRLQHWEGLRSLTEIWFWWWWAHGWYWREPRLLQSLLYHPGTKPSSQEERKKSNLLLKIKDFCLTTNMSNNSMWVNLKNNMIISRVDIGHFEISFVTDIDLNLLFYLNKIPLGMMYLSILRITLLRCC